MDNPELVLQSLEHFPKLMDEGDYSIPMELEDYIHYVAKTGDPVFQWTLVKPLFREKIIKVVTDFFESTPGEIPDYPNVNKFNYDSMKATLLERIDWFKGAPFTIQRISELLVHPTKEYNRVDKYMRALEKNIYVVSTREPGMPQPAEENNTTFEESFIMNGNDFEMKSESSELLGNKEEDDNAAALLLLKKCNDSEADEVNFNIEVDVTNTTPSEDVQADNIVDSAEINVLEETAESTESSEGSLNISDGKCGQTRKHEEEDGGVEENEPKRFKMDEDDNENEIKEDSEVVTEEVPSQEVDLNAEPSLGDSINVSQEQDVDSKSDNEMELEETVDNKIESFDTLEKDQNNSLLNVSEGDSMVISSQETSEENIETSIEENLDPVVSESSDMDLSDGVASELPPALLEQPDPDKVDVTDQPLLTEKQEDISTSSTDTANDEISVDKEISSEVEPSVQDPSKEAVSESSSEQNSDNIQPDLSPVSETTSPNEEETKPAEEVQSSEQSSADNNTSQDDINKATVESEAASVENTPEVEQAILQEDEFTEVEETGSNIDPLSTESVDDSEEIGKVVLTDDKDKDTSANEDVVAEPPQVDSS
uniref:Serine/threonine-protein phosphatase 4 regulatory subunit 2 n=1 Tax=Cacopsylla melanoneura TaxID=428564 RepID=A0A8D9F0W6_9HEMI